MTVVLKLGGSLITEKDERETIDREALETASRAIGDASVTDLVLVHGGGSFGHHHAAEQGVSNTAGTTDHQAVRTIHEAMGRLNTAVLDHLGDEGIPAVPVRPFSAGYRPAADEIWLATEQVRAMVAEGFVPVLHGDVFATLGEGATIVSGDELVVSLASNLAADRVGLCGGVPGVLDEAGVVVEEVRTLDSVAEALGGSDATDVTGGMAAKVEALLSIPTPAAIFDLEGLPSFLDGGTPGTLVLGSE